MTSPDAALAHIGEGWVAEEAVLMALYCFLKSPDDFLATIRQGANTQGIRTPLPVSPAASAAPTWASGPCRRPWIARLEKSKIPWRTSPTAWPRRKTGK